MGTVKKDSNCDASMPTLAAAVHEGEKESLVYCGALCTAAAAVDEPQYTRDSYPSCSAARVLPSNLQLLQYMSRSTRVIKIISCTVAHVLRLMYCGAAACSGGQNLACRNWSPFYTIPLVCLKISKCWIMLGQYNKLTNIKLLEWVIVIGIVIPNQY